MWNGEGENMIMFKKKRLGESHWGWVHAAGWPKRASTLLAPSLCHVCHCSLPVCSLSLTVMGRWTVCSPDVCLSQALLLCDMPGRAEWESPGGFLLDKIAPHCVAALTLEALALLVDSWRLWPGEFYKSTRVLLSGPQSSLRVHVSCDVC